MALGYIFAVVAALASGSGSTLESLGIRRAGAANAAAALVATRPSFVIVTDIAGTVLNFSTAQTAPLSLTNITPTITAEQATGLVRSQLSGGRLVDPVQLVVLARLSGRLVWRATVLGASSTMFSRLTVHIDALTGSVVDREERAARGTGNGALSGRVPLDTTPTVGGHVLDDPVGRPILAVLCAERRNR